MTGLGNALALLHQTKVLNLSEPEKADVIFLDKPQDIPKSMVSKFGKACRWICINSKPDFSSGRFEEIIVDFNNYVDDVRFKPVEKFPGLEDLVLFYCVAKPEEPIEYDLAIGPYKEVDNYIGYAMPAEALEMALSAKNLKTNSPNMMNTYKHFSGEKTLKPYSDLTKELKI